MKVSTKKHRATIFQCILSSRETFGEVVPKILLNAPLCSRPAPSGAPKRKALPAKQLVVDEDSEILFHKLPEGRKKKKKNPHDLMDAVKNNRGAEKKH